jgi:hypothetical protein
VDPGVRGPGELDANLTWLVKKNQPNLEHFKVTCEKRDDFPYPCRFTATDTSRKKPLKVVGRASITDIYAPTSTYVYSLTYGPRKYGLPESG